MAIAPNTTFVSGAIYTAAQANAYGFGIVAQESSTTTTAGPTSTEAITITASTFTAIANRYYRITYIEPACQPATGVSNVINLRIRLTNTSGTIFGQGQYQQDSNNGASQSVCVVGLATLSAGSTVIVGTAIVNGGTGACNRSASAIARIIVEDIGPA